jgi:hypothetical protein
MLIECGVLDPGAAPFDYLFDDSRRRPQRH